MPVDLYYMAGSPPCATVRLAAKVLGVELNLKVVELFNGEHLKPEFVKLNPLHAVPLIDDNGYLLPESRAIIIYLQDQYGKDNSLYPKNPKERGIVNQRLFFDLSVLYQSLRESYFGAIHGKPIKQSEKLEKLEEALKVFDKFLEASTFAAGDTVTLADITLVVTVAYLDVLEHDLTPYKNILKWYSKVKPILPGYSEILEGSTDFFKKAYDGLLAKQSASV